MPKASPASPDDDRQLLATIEELRSLFPDWRIGQLVANLTQAAGRDRKPSGMWKMTNCWRRPAG